ncbi:MAG: ATP-binding protein [Roseburia sp.]
MELQKLLSYTRRAVDDYQLIEAGDKIAVGVSGGKDSLTLLYALKHLQRFYPTPFELVAVTVDLGYDGFHLESIRALCHELEIPYQVIPTDIAHIVFNPEGIPLSDGSPCALCAKLRKGALNNAVLELGCNKVAYAHHQDDMIETLFLSLIFEGRFYVFPPKTFLDRTKLTVIRPLMYVSEAEIKGFQKKYQLPVVKNPCPMDGSSKRQYAKELVRQLNLDHPGVKKRLFHAITEGNIPGWQNDASEWRKK